MKQGTKMKLLTLLLLILISASCITKIKSDKTIDRQKLTNSVFKGRSAIIGKVSTIDGHTKMVTKADSQVVLIPVCEASTDIISQIYPNTEASSRSVKDHPRIEWGQLQDFLRVTHTDEYGSFTIANISPGDYYLLSYIKVRDKLSIKGGSVMRKLNIEKSKVKKVSLRL